MGRSLRGHPYHPLYAGLTAALERVVNDWEIAALSISVIGGTAAVLALFVFLRDSFDARSAALQPQARSRDAFIAAILVFYGVVLVGLLANYGYLSRRHVLPLLPLLLGYAGLGAGWLVDRVGNRSKNREAERPGRVPRLAPAGLMAGLALLMFGIAAPKALHDQRQEVLALRDGNRFRSFESLVRERVRYIVVDDRALPDPDPGFELRELHRSAAKGRGGRVYELTRAAGNEPPQVGASIAAGPPDHETH